MKKWLNTRRIKADSSLLRMVYCHLLCLSILNANPTHFWPFYGNADEAFTVNATLTSDRFNNPDYAYQFDGTSSYIEFTDSPELDITGELSIETWVFLDSMVPGSDRTILIKCEGLSNVATPNTYYLGTSGDSTYKFCVGGQEMLFGDVMYNQWTHLAATFSHELMRARCYVNNELALDHPALLYDIQTSDYPLLIGSNAEHDENWHGIIDDVRLFDRVISEIEIDSLYTIPFDLNLVTIPSENLNFGYVYVGFPETTYVEIRNYSLETEPLLVDSVSFSYPMFETDFSPFSLESGEVAQIGVICNPTDNFRFTESIFISSNDTTNNPYEITLTGQSLNPPDMVITPSSINETLYTGGIVNYTFTIDNSSGDGVLGWTSKVVDGDSATAVFFERPDIVDWNEPVNQDRITPRVWLTRDNAGGMFNAFFESSANQSFTPSRIKWASGPLPQPEWNYSEGNIVNDDPSTFLGQILSAYCYDDDQYIEVVFESWSETGGGFSYTRSFVPPYWLKYAAVHETEYTHGIHEQDLVLDATGMRGGEHRINIRVDSNSPEAPVVYVPISLAVIEAPDYESRVSSLDFNQGFIGYPDTIEMEITNAGFGDLVISDISLPGMDILVTPSSATIPEDTSIFFEFVFNPLSIGDQSGDIVITTNDPDELNIIIPTIATGQYPPVIEASIREITQPIEENEIVEQSFTVRNTGQSDLNFELYAINYIEDSPANQYDIDHYEAGTFWGPTYHDAMETNVLLDLESLSIGQRGDEVLFRLQAYESMHFRTTEISFDVDMNSQTGFEKGPQFGWQLGTEYGIEVSGNRIEITDHDTWEFTNLSLSTFDFEPFSNSMIIGIPSSLFGNSTGWNVGVLGSWFWYPDALPSDGSPYIHVPLMADWINHESGLTIVAPGDSIDVTITIDAHDLPLGTINALLHIVSNDPEKKDLIIPLSVDILIGTKVKPAIPHDYALHQNFPNPFNPATTIEFELPEHSEVSLIIYDIAGREIATLVSNDQTAGSYTATWNGTDQNGRQVSGGMYFARLQAGENSSVIKMVYLR